MRVSHEPLFGFAAALGIGRHDLSDVETPNRLAGTFEVNGTAVSAAVTSEALDSLASEYGDAVRLAFRIGALDEFTFNGSYSAEALAQFVLGAGQTHTYDLLLEVEKRPLIERILDGEPICEAVLYFTEDAVIAALRSGIASVEKALWLDTTRRLLILVLDHDLLLSGSSLSIAGGVHLDEAAGEAVRPPIDPELTSRAARRRDDYIGWDAQFATSLTPWHFHIEKTAESATAPYIDAAFVLLAVLFTCDRARAISGPGRRPHIQAEFRGREHVASVPILEGEPLFDVSIQSRTAIRPRDAIT